MGEGDLNAKNMTTTVMVTSMSRTSLRTSRSVKLLLVFVTSTWRTTFLPTAHTSLLSPSLSSWKNFRITGLIRTGRQQHGYNCFRWFKVGTNPSVTTLLHCLHRTPFLWVRTSHLSNAKIHHQLEAGPELHLLQKLRVTWSLLLLTLITLPTGTL